MRSAVVYIAFLFMSVQSFAQLADTVIGKSYNTDRKENFSGFIGENATTLFTVDYLYASRRKQELIVRKFYKSDLQLIDSKNIYAEPQGNFYSEPTEVFFHEGNIYLFSSLFGEKGNPDLIQLKIFNDNMEKMSSGIVDTIKADEEIIIQESEDKDRFIICRYSKYSNLTQQEIRLTEVSNTGVVKWSERVKSPMALQNLSIEDIVFSGSSPVFVLANYAFDLKNRNAISEQDMINNKYSLWAYDPDNHFLKEFELRLKGRWINGIELGINRSGQLVVSGYINETRNRAINGIFSLLLDKNLEVKNSFYETFDKRIRRKFVEEKKLDKEKELDDYILKKLVIRKDGSYFLLGERYYKYIERNYDPRTNITTTTEHFNYNSIIVSYFDSLGNHIWTERVPKYQSSTNDYGYFASFCWFNSKNGVYLFFNDTEKNNDVALNDYFNYRGLFNNRRSQITCVHINNEGIVKRSPLISSDSDYLLRAKQSYQIERNVMYLMTESSSRNSRIVSVGVKEGD